MGSIPRGLSGSRSSAILGFNNWKTPLAAWQEIMEELKPGFNAERGFDYEEFEGNTATEFGLAFEQAVIKTTQDLESETIIHQEKSFSLDGADHITCHIDGILNGTDRLFEGKTTNIRAFGMKWGEPGTDKIPQEYQVQIQHCLMLTGKKEAILSVLVFPNPVNDWEKNGWSAHYDNLNGVHFLSNKETGKTIDPLSWAKSLSEMGYFHTYNIQAKPEVQKLLRELYNDFWTKYVLTETAPDIVDYEDVKRVFTAPKGTLIVGKKIASIMREYKDITKEIGNSGHLAKRKVQIKTEVLKFAREETTVADDESQEKIVFYDESGNKVGSFDGKTFRS